MAESTLIPSIIREVKKVSQSGAMKFLDVNGDGKFTMQDVRDLQWEQIAKLATVVAILAAASYYAVPL